MREMVQDHEKRIISLEQNYSEVQRELTTVQNSQLRTENTVLSESLARDILRIDSTIHKLFKMMEDDLI